MRLPEPDQLLASLAPYRDGLVVGCGCPIAGHWLADWWAAAGKHGAAAFTPFKNNSVPVEPWTLWDWLFGYHQFNRADFLTHYLARSNVESTFSMVKAKFRNHVRSKSHTAMKNEVLLKLLCHNVVVVHQAIIELGIEGRFWQEKARRAVRDILLLQRGG